MEAQDLEQIFSSTGLIARNFPRYEYRPQQLEFAAAVKEAIREKLHLIAEAPTGVGKSFAYSVPLIYGKYSVKTSPHGARSNNFPFISR